MSVFISFSIFIPFLSRSKIVTSLFHFHNLQNFELLVSRFFVYYLKYCEKIHCFVADDAMYVSLLTGVDNVTSSAVASGRFSLHKSSLYFTITHDGWDVHRFSKSNSHVFPTLPKQKFQQEIVPSSTVHIHSTFTTVSSFTVNVGYKGHRHKAHFSWSQKWNFCEFPRLYEIT